MLVVLDSPSLSYTVNLTGRNPPFLNVYVTSSPSSAYPSRSQMHLIILPSISEERLALNFIGLFNATSPASGIIAAIGGYFILAYIIYLSQIFHGIHLVRPLRLAGFYTLGFLDFYRNILCIYQKRWYECDQFYIPRCKIRCRRKCHRYKYHHLGL